MDEKYKNNVALKQFLYDCRKKPLVLFLGAGIMTGIVPLWEKIVNILFENALKYRIDTSNLQTKDLLQKLEKHFNLYEKSTIIKNLVLNESQYLYHLKDEIYREYNAKYRGNGSVPLPPYFESIVELCLSSNAVNAIVTYNYDDILMNSINSKGKDKKCRTAQCFFGPDIKTDTCGSILPIYHIHGFLPNNNLLPDMENSMIVLSFDEYFSNMMQPYSWQTVTQMFFLCNYTCLYIGTSLSDINMLRILDYAGRNKGMGSVYLLACGESMCDRQICGDEDEEGHYTVRLKSTLYNSFNIRLIYCGNEYDSMTLMIKDIGRLLNEGGNNETV